MNIHCNQILFSCSPSLQLSESHGVSFGIVNLRVAAAADSWAGQQKPHVRRPDVKHRTSPSDLLAAPRWSTTPTRVVGPPRTYFTQHTQGVVVGRCEVFLHDSCDVETWASGACGRARRCFSKVCLSRNSMAVRLPTRSPCSDRRCRRLQDPRKEAAQASTVQKPPERACWSVSNMGRSLHGVVRDGRADTSSPSQVERHQVRHSSYSEEVGRPRVYPAWLLQLRCRNERS